VFFLIFRCCTPCILPLLHTNGTRTPGVSSTARQLVEPRSDNNTAFLQFYESGSGAGGMPAGFDLSLGRGINSLLSLGGSIILPCFQSSLACSIQPFPACGYMFYLSIYLCIQLHDKSMTTEINTREIR
jgi:hypothetical protein